jgi:hypothetical protein
VKIATLGVAVASAAYGLFFLLLALFSRANRLAVSRSWGENDIRPREVSYPLRLRLLACLLHGITACIRSGHRGTFLLYWLYSAACLCSCSGLSAF